MPNFSYLIPDRTFVFRLQNPENVLVEVEYGRVAFQNESQLISSGTDKRRWQWRVVLKNGCFNFRNVYFGGLLQIAGSNPSGPRARFCVGEESNNGCFKLYHNDEGQLDPWSTAALRDPNSTYPILFDDVANRHICHFKFELIQS
ncbi:hypothetical protein TSTA_015470 [Talaromyces stipitatus ATCC 10500]|uniref:Ricin B lectin domain-containing protein n=1 Tax=Talaromyces stipitatus (strain ATCC 10500 / CBS 375.48 / QM 6759 / NRRL 1006) TaxID=441959 RepID=B8MHY1_TALSN|nr:uncharacterized protein TSTA_015470 [Talaromyces stipitatus ATCC 10500]EED16461.1 hypothetical protein TSTA_015470 [Talaromyces stipitatus ATCC 10500]